MKVNFTSNEELAPDDIEVVVSAAVMNGEVLSLMQQIQNLTPPSTTLPITLEDRVVLLPISDIISIEVFGTEISVQTVGKSYTTKGQLKKFHARLPQKTFIQISKSALINIEHLEYLEAGFSGNMTAFLTNNNRASVSRKYLPDLKQTLGL
jgi:two-component system response regulator LytT